MPDRNNDHRTPGRDGEEVTTEETPNDDGCGAARTPVRADGAGLREPEARPGQVSEPTSRLIAALVGAAVTFVASIVFSIIPVVGNLAALLAGGAAAGYLRGSDTTESAITGGLAGVIASAPLILVAGVVMFTLGVGAVGEGAIAGGVVGLAIVAALVLLVVGFVAVVCAAGGAIGAAVTDRPAPR